MTETLHGVTIIDPYRWMENGGDEFSAWLKAQDAYTRSVLDRIPGREKLLARIGQLNESVSQVDVERLPDNRYLLLKRHSGTRPVPIVHVLHVRPFECGILLAKGCVNEANLVRKEPLVPANPHKLASTRRDSRRS